MLNSKCFEDKALQEAQDIFRTKRNGMIHMLIKRGAHLEQVLTLEYLCIDIIMLDLLSARRFAEKEMLVCKNGGKIKENRLYNYGFKIICQKFPKKRNNGLQLFEGEANYGSTSEKVNYPIVNNIELIINCNLF